MPKFRVYGVDQQGGSRSFETRAASRNHASAIGRVSGLDVYRVENNKGTTAVESAAIRLVIYALFGFVVVLLVGSIIHYAGGAS